VNALLPEHLARVTIKDLIVGEEAYTVPWSIQVDENGRCWIRGDYAFTHRQFGTSKTFIKRTIEGFEVEVMRGTQYEQSRLSPEARLQMDLMPIVSIS
jgi:hypothetical protein